MVPQADDLDIVHHAVVGVKNGKQFEPELAELLIEQTGREWTRRQADYYAIAAHAVGLLEIDTGAYEVRGTEQEARKWVLPEEGEKYVDIHRHDPAEADKFLYDLIDEMEIMKRGAEPIQEEIAIFQSEVAEIIGEHTGVSGSTADRRANTIGRWIEQKDGEIKRMPKGGDIKYANQTTIGDDFN